MSPNLAQYRGLTQPSKAGAVWTGKVAMVRDEKFLEPLRKRKPLRIFVNSMGDLFHESVPDAWIDKVFAVMALAPQHTFIVLTKRSARMREYMNDPVAPMRIYAAMADLPHAEKRKMNEITVAYILLNNWPLPNVWLGVSAEDQTRYDERKEDLRATPAAVHGFSFEPLLGPIKGDYFGEWCIVGGESGPGARPMHPDWARGIREQCEREAVSFFFKQWGEYTYCQINDTGELAPPLASHELGKLAFFAGKDRVFIRAHKKTTCKDAFARLNTLALRVGKSRAGRLLDGVTHDAMPGVG